MDRLVADELDLGAGARDAGELAEAIGGHRDGAGVGEERGAVVDARVVARVVRGLLVADVRAAAREAVGPFGRGGGRGVGGVLRAGDVEGAAVRESEPGGARQDGAAAGGDEVTGHARIVQHGQRTGAGLDDLARAGEDADGTFEILVDVDAQAVVVGGAGGDGRLELVVVVPRLEVMEEVEAEGVRAGADVDGGVGEADLRRTVEDDRRGARHALGQGVDEVRGAGARRDVGDLGRDLDRREDVGVDRGAEIMPHVDVAAHHEQAAIDTNLALHAVQTGDIGAIRVADDGRGEVTRTDVVDDGVGAREAEGRPEERLHVRVRPGVRAVAEHVAGVALILQDGATGLGDVAEALEATGDGRGDEALEDDRAVGVGRDDLTAEARRVAEDDVGLGGDRPRHTGDRQGDVADLQRAVRGGRVGRADEGAREVDILETGDGRLDARGEGPRQQTITRGREKQRLGLAGNDARIDEDVARQAGRQRRPGEGQRRRIGEAGTRDARGGDVVAGRGRGEVLADREAGVGRDRGDERIGGDAGAGDLLTDLETRRVRGEDDGLTRRGNPAAGGHGDLQRGGLGRPIVMGERRGIGRPQPLVPDAGTALAIGPEPGRLGHVLLGLGNACGSKHSGGHQQRLRNPHGEGSG